MLGILTMTTPANAYQIDTPDCLKVRKLAAAIGWPRQQLDTLQRIAARESTCRASALNPNDPTIYGSRGLMQINGSNVRWLIARGIIRNADDLYNPTRNLRAALALWREYGWRPWSGSSHV